MCGRYTLTQEQEALDAALGVEGLLHPRPRYNVAPTQEAPVIVGSSSGPVGAVMRWGLIPSWAEDPRMGSRMINARSETVDRKPSFRVPFQRFRCLVPADGFFEWKEEGGRKVPFLIRLPSGEPFTFAGLWDRWSDPEGASIRSFTILTREALPVLAPLHPRMPVILPQEARDAWLDPGTPVPELMALLQADCGGGEGAGGFEVTAVSARVNSPRNDDPGCVAPAGEAAGTDDGEAGAREGTGAEEEGEPPPVQGSLFS
jgi:putative SOS response-associated peptidase YedK